MNEKYIQMLRDAIQQAHHCVSRYAQAVAVKEEVNGQIVWEGKVEVFDLAAHPKARQCYAWSFKDDKGRLQYVTFLRLAPIETAQAAVKAFLVSHAK